MEKYDDGKLPMGLMPNFILRKMLNNKLGSKITQKVVRFQILLLNWFASIDSDGFITEDKHRKLVTKLKELIQTLMTIYNLEPDEVLKCGHYGNKKYGYGNFLTIKNDQKLHVNVMRLFDAFLRHSLKVHLGNDDESGLPHLYHAVYNLWMIYNLLTVHSTKTKLSFEVIEMFDEQKN